MKARESISFLAANVVGSRLAALLLAFLVGVAIAVAMPSQAADAVTRGPFPADRTKTVCVYDAPGDITVSQARQRLNDAIEDWETTGGIDGVPAIDFTATTNCSSADIKIGVATLPDRKYAVTYAHSIYFTNIWYNWYVGDGDPPFGQLSYEGILVHELGHTVGIGHSGNQLWSDDPPPPPPSPDVGAPSMQDCVSIFQAQFQVSVRRDDWGSAVNIGGHSTGKPAYLNANPGFERGSAHWGWSGSGDVAISGSYKKTGAYGARLRSGRWMWAGTSYDPWDLNDDAEIVPADDMDQYNVDFTISSWARQADKDQSGGIRFKYNRRYVDYNEGDACKSSDPQVRPWYGQLTAGGVWNLSGTSWHYCYGEFDLPFWPSDPMAMIRPLILSTSSGYVYLDRTGITGGTQS